MPGLARCFSSTLSLGDRGKVMAQPGCVPGLGCHRGGAGFGPPHSVSGVRSLFGKPDLLLLCLCKTIPCRGFNFCCRKASLLVLSLLLLPQRLEKPS